MSEQVVMHVGLTGCCGCCWIISLLCLSLATISPLEYGFSYSGWKKEIGSEPLKPGINWVGPMNSMITYPSVQQIIEFSSNKGADFDALTSRTSEGLEVDISFSFLYQIQEDKMFDLFGYVEFSYASLYEKIARDVIMQQIGSYEASATWLNRDQLQTEMQGNLSSKLQQVGAVCNSLMLLDISLPDTYEDAIVDTQVTIQQESTATIQREVDLVNTNTTVLTAQYTAEANIIQANATAYATYYTTTGQGSIYNTTATYLGQSYNAIYEQLGMTTSDQLLDYIYYLNIYNLNSTYSPVIMRGLTDTIIKV